MGVSQIFVFLLELTAVVIREELQLQLKLDTFRNAWKKEIKAKETRKDVVLINRL